MQVYGPLQVHGPQAITAPHTQRVNSPADAGAPSTPIRDDVQISDTAHFLSQINDLPAIRADRVQQLREAIASGNYMTEDKLNTALDRLLEEIA